MFARRVFYSLLKFVWRYRFAQVIPSRLRSEGCWSWRRWWVHFLWILFCKLYALQQFEAFRTMLLTLPTWKVCITTMLFKGATSVQLFIQPSIIVALAGKMLWNPWNAAYLMLKVSTVLRQNVFVQVKVEATTFGCDIGWIFLPREGYTRWGDSSGEVCSHFWCGVWRMGGWFFSLIDLFF